MRFWNKEVIYVEDEDERPLFEINPDTHNMYIKFFINNDLNKEIEYFFSEDQLKKLIEIFQHWLDNKEKGDRLLEV